LEQARAELQRVVAAAPTLGIAWLAYGDVLVDLEKYPDARVAYDRSRACDPHARRIEEATAALVAEDRKTAESIFREILKTDAGHVAAVCGLAAISLTASRPADALRLLRHALKQSAHLPLIFRGLCQALTDLSQLPEAEKAVRYLLKIEPENAQNWVTLGNVCTRMMRQAEALTAFQEADALES
jgi:predicted Zn-dependent protease